MSLLVSVMLAVAQPGQPTPPALTVSDMAWLSGVWLSRTKDGQWSDEYWTLPRGGMMLGAGMTGKGDAVSFFEHMRIATGADGRIAFHATVNGGAVVVFPLVYQQPNMVVFQNPKHDYPQRIVYQYSEGRVFATVSKLDGSRAAILEYKRPG